MQPGPKVHRSEWVVKTNKKDKGVIIGSGQDQDLIEEVMDEEVEEQRVITEVDMTNPLKEMISESRKRLFDESETDPGISKLNSDQGSLIVIPTSNSFDVLMELLRLLMM